MLREICVLVVVWETDEWKLMYMEEKYIMNAAEI
jgi:hypothetical protein